MKKPSLSHDPVAETAVRQLPLKPVVYLILFSLVEDSRHGYGIKKRVRELSDDAVVLDPGTLYRWMARLLDDGWVEESDRQPVAGEDGRRRYYDLTPLGRRIVELESRRLARLVEGARRFDLIRKPGQA